MSILQEKKYFQLELDLWQEFKEAELAPERSEPLRLCKDLEQAIATSPPEAQLQTAANALVRIAEIFALRAEALLTNWEETYSYDGPALEDDDLGELLRQSMALELDELIEDREPIVRRQQSTNSTTEESVAGEVEKATLLETFDSEIGLAETQAQVATTASHEEDVTAWAEAIAEWWAASSGSEPVSLIELQQELGMPLIEVWLGLLLGSGFELEQQGNFYDPETIFVNLEGLR